MLRRSLEFGILSATVLLLISRSVLLPTWASQLAPILALSFVTVGLLPHIRTLRIPATAGLLVLLTVTYAFSSAASGSLDNFLRATTIGCLWLVVFIVAFNLCELEKRRLFVFIVGVAVIETFIAVGETVLSIPELRAHVAATQDGSYLVRPNTILGPWTNRAQGTVGYPIPFSHVLSLSAVIALFAPLNWGLPRRLLISTLLGIGVVLTGTRSGAAALVACVLVGLFLLFKGKLSGLKHLLFMLLVVVGFLSAASISSQESLSGDGSYTHRIGILGSFLELFKLPAERVLFGSGINSHESLFLLRYFVSNSTYAIDNSFVTLFIYTGLVGLAAFVGLVFVGIRKGSVDEVSILVGFVVFAMSYDFVNWHLLAFIFFLILGLSHRGKPENTIRSEYASKITSHRLNVGSS